MKDSNIAIHSKGTPLWRMSKKFQYAAEKIIPDSFVFCLILTFIVFLAALVGTGTNPITLITYWADGLWTQLTFAMQMSLMVVVCATTAKSGHVKNALLSLAKLVRTPSAAMVLLMAFGFASSFVNWAFCTIITPILAMQLSKNIKGLHFPMMLAAGYTTMIFGQCLGPTASVYATIATEGHALADVIGVVTQDISVYNPINVTIWIIMAVVFMVLAIFTRPPAHELVEFRSEINDTTKDYKMTSKETVADKMNGSRIIMWLVGIFSLIYIISSFATKGFMGSLSVNFIILIFLAANCFLYNSPRAFVEAHKDNMFLGCEVMIQFPFYGGIMGIMQSSGLALIIVSFMVSIANAQTMPIMSFLSASVVNLFIPSQGGQWIVQGPLIIEAAQQTGADVITCINAFVHGDEATNLLQPLYLIPALSVVGMKLKDAWGFCAFIWVFWTVMACVGFYFIPMFF